MNLDCGLCRLDSAPPPLLDGFTAVATSWLMGFFVRSTMPQNSALLLCEKHGELFKTVGGAFAEVKQVGGAPVPDRGTVH